MKSFTSLLFAASGLVASASAQAAGWVPDQINATMCYWEQPRAAVVRDTLYIDGGNLWWIPGMDNGSYGAVTSDQNPLGIVYTLNFSVPFKTSDNLTADMGVLYKVSPGSNANNIAPNYLDGAMLANDDEWFLYGGLLRNTAQYSMPDSDAAQMYQADQYGIDKPSFRPGFINVDLPANMTRYVAYGGAASAPSENKAWYFSGLRSPSWGPIYMVSGVDSLTAINVSNTLITVDMATQNSETWTNVTLPPTVDGRANPELVWVPVGAQGILVAIGGVIDPEWVSVSGKSENSAASKAASPTFVTTLDVYDVASKTWYKQPTTGGGNIGQRARACAVVATAADASSFNIYYYGGFDGINVGDTFNDDVWVLSLPSFTWTQVYESTDASTHGRAGHKCVAPYPDQMFVVGGYTPKAGGAAGCLGGGVVQVFNLSSAAWIQEYTPTKWSDYSVPDAVVKVIGGSGKGGATATAPAASGGWAATGLSSVFATAYPTSKLTTYYPYPLNASATAAPNNTHPDAPDSSTTSGHHTPKFVAPLVGVIGGLIVITAIAVTFLLYRRRRILMYGSTGTQSGAGAGGRRSSRGTGPVGGSGLPGTESVATYDTGRNFVFSWLRAQPSVKHASTPATSSYDDPHSGSNGRIQSYGGQFSSSTPISPEMEQLQAANLAAQHSGQGQGGGYFYGHGHGQSPLAAAGGVAAAPAVEADNTYISEMIADTKYRAELPDTSDFTGSVTTDANSNSRMVRGNYYHSVPSSSAELESPLNHGGAASNVANHGSNSSYSNLPQQTQQQQPPVVARADSPSLGQAPQFVALPPQQQQSAQPSVTHSVARESGVSDLSEQDRRHLRQGSEGGQSATSGVSSAVGTSGYQRNSLNLSGAVSPLGSQFPPSVTGIVAGGAQPHATQPIPEAEAGAEAAAEAAAQPSAPLPMPTPPVQTDLDHNPLQSPSQTSLQGSGGDSPGQLRRSVFRESEADLRE